MFQFRTVSVFFFELMYPICVSTSRLKMYTKNFLRVYRIA